MSPSDPAPTLLSDPADPRHERLGAGRSGVVYRDRDELGRAVARKVFASDTLTKLVQFVFLGTPNPYAWNEHAVQAAVLRRQILEPLVRHWFGDRLRVARAWSQDWNEDHLAYQLHTEFVQGRPPRLQQPPREGLGDEDELRELVDEVMRPLQRRLDEAGFDGLVWQAGRGNPVAAGNFLRETTSAGARWAWIDLESGVPALFPLDPRALFGFYLPRSLRQRRPLFDDVDVPRLRSWLDAHRSELEGALGPAEVRRLLERVEALAFHQRSWKGLSRTRAGIARRLALGEINAVQAAWYARRPLRWCLRELWQGARAGMRLAARQVRRLWERARAIPFQQIAVGLLRFLTSQRYRRGLAQILVRVRVAAWEERGQLSGSHADRLRAQVERRESAAYLTDFGVHVALKPFVKLVEYLVLPGLFVAGVINTPTLAVAMVAAGPMARTLYTSGRLVQALGRGRKLPWTALVTGVVPVFGNLAYPLQIVASSRGRDDPLARFMLVDACTLLGRRLPIWGGADTLTEHAFNRLPAPLLRVPVEAD